MSTILIYFIYKKSMEYIKHRQDSTPRIKLDKATKKRTDIIKITNYINKKPRFILLINHAEENDNLSEIRN